MKTAAIAIILLLAVSAPAGETMGEWPLNYWELQKAAMNPKEISAPIEWWNCNVPCFKIHPNDGTCIN